MGEDTKSVVENNERVTLSVKELESLIKEAVDTALRNKDLSEKGETRDGDKIVMTSQALKERLDRARNSERSKLAKMAGVEPEQLESWLQEAKKAKDELAKLKEEEVPEEEIKKFEAELDNFVKSLVDDEKKQALLKQYFYGWAARTDNLGDDPLKTFKEHVEKEINWMIEKPKEEPSKDSTQTPSQSTEQQEQPTQEEEKKEEKPKATTAADTSATPKEGATKKEEAPDVRDPNKVSSDEFYARLRQLGINPDIM